ncbi:proton-conducting transporter membrane subunit [Gemmata sp. JC673]|uniref:Proton-conducting transporter membrane subunit n=1 Tax=Gemmata algarum TaxID=2975278 RepID=A0ABU5EVD4_9BACT|nr:proton-conducting transporter membrane subunit [Gemmata algarum]MDY3559150.1 proton-conducting transporter membrane subunit [Gemmata algarum]
MTFGSVPWLECAVAVPLAGALCLSRVCDVRAASRWCLAFMGTGLACAVAAWAGFAFGGAADGSSPDAVLPRLFGRPVFTLDALSAPLVPLVALLHFLTALATARTKMTRFSFAWLLAGAALRVATFACRGPWDLGVLLLVGVAPAYFELRRRGRPVRVYAVHMALFAGLLVTGLLARAIDAPALAAVLLMGAVLVRSGTCPVHVWVTNLFENGSFGGALLFVAPITGMYAALRLVLPLHPPEWVLQTVGIVSLATAVYAAGMAVVQADARRFFAYLFLSHASLVLVGLELHTSISLTGALALWGSVMVSLSGFGLTIRALEARFGRLTLSEFRGLYAASPALAVCFLLTGLASVGFPGMSGFIAAELLVDGAVGTNLFVGLVVVGAAALNGVAVLRAYFALFTGTRYTPGVSVGITTRERVAVLTLTALIFAAGFFPQAYVLTRHRAAEEALAGEPATEGRAEH